MKTKYWILFICIVSITNLLAQPLEEEQQMFKVLKSGKKNVKVFFDKKLVAVWNIDTSLKIIEQHRLEFSIINTIAPKFDNKYSTASLRKYYFNADNNLDSVVKVDYYNNLFLSNDSLLATEIDTVVIKYTYPLLENWVMNKKEYIVRKGKRGMYKSTYYGYNLDKKIILEIQNEGSEQFFYSYNGKGKVDKYSYFGFKRENIYETTFEYDDEGSLIKKKFGSGSIHYEYYENSLLKRVITNRDKNKEEIVEYEYY